MTTAPKSVLQNRLDMALPYVIQAVYHDQGRRYREFTRIPQIGSCVDAVLNCPGISKNVQSSRTPTPTWHKLTVLVRAGYESLHALMGILLNDRLFELGHYYSS
jgi:hypothetical protein